ncbi:C4-dicarboxylate transport system permease small protein [Corynebacterium suranareeae]|uniref:C4-dicarboxylate transport system permease small protein n=1 Tax=Corynebacterium suranareeae TaxID=2506452 RepID=A0A160PSI0_9CORY|nr:TRAP transporter small permease [Corynebacterium suranareeae]BAU96676.1 C4-dicarboxylate transport system permease small protein [Corynebacterium suranareeae]
MMTLKSGITKALGFASTILFAVLVCVTVWQVFSRQVLHNPSTWSEELSKLLFVWLSFIGSAFLFGERGHIAVDFLARKLPLKTQRVLQVIVQLLVVLFALLGMIWGGYLAASIAWNQQLTALPLTIGWVYVVIPIAGIFIALFAIIDLISVASGKEDPYPEVDESEEPRDLDELEGHDPSAAVAGSAEGKN